MWQIVYSYSYLSTFATLLKSSSGLLSGEMPPELESQIFELRWGGVDDDGFVQRHLEIKRIQSHAMSRQDEVGVPAVLAPR